MVEEIKAEGHLEKQSMLKDAARTHGTPSIISLTAGALACSQVRC